MEDSILPGSAITAVPSPACATDERYLAVRELTDIVLGRDLAAARRLLAARMAAGTSVDAILSDYLAPTARRLGALWESDHVDFSQVTAGVGRLQDLERHVSDGASTLANPLEAPRILLATVPGEQHSFGIALVASQLHRRGWDVTGAPSREAEELLEAAGRGWYETIGLSLCTERHVEGLGEFVARLRERSMNRDVRVILGGRLPDAHPELAGEVEADAYAADGVELAAD